MFSEVIIISHYIRLTDLHTAQKSSFKHLFPRKSKSVGICSSQSKYPSTLKIRRYSYFIRTSNSYNFLGRQRVNIPFKLRHSSCIANKDTASWFCGGVFQISLYCSYNILPTSALSSYLFSKFAIPPMLGYYTSSCNTIGCSTM